ncbi:hypothetical protein ES707_13200 [subsurface metagenome]
MINTIVSFTRRCFSFWWITGPIFDKELRVSSRRRRNYLLRFVYLGLLTLFLVLFWLEVVRQSGNSAAYRASRMAEAGMGITAYIIWFQFLATQLVAVIMLSTSISDEVYHRTLGSLMSTPINSFQIVMGKLFSKLLQIIILLAISMPLLAIVRIFGGVQWNFILSSLCITLTTVIFVGSLSLFYSILNRRAYVVIILTFLTVGLLFAVLPMITGLLNETYDIYDEMEFFTVLSYVNPYLTLGANTEKMTSAGGMFTFSWPLHCGIMLAGAAVILAVSVSMVRKVALLQAIGQLDGSRKRRIFKKSKGGAQPEYASRIKRVKGPAVLWKELRSPIFGRRKLITFIILFIGLALLVITYVLIGGENNLDDEVVHMIYTCVFMSIGLLFTIILPATSITSEKESLSWPILLATPLSDGNIMSGKFIGAIRRSLPIWLLLFGHIILFSLIGYIHPFAIFMMAVVVAGIIVLLCGSGIYFSTRFKKTTTAVVMNFSFAVLIWAIIPFIMALILAISRSGEDIIENYCEIIPFVQGVLVMDVAAGSSGSLEGPVHWPSGQMDIMESTFLMIKFMLGYMLVGLLFAWRAKCRFRKHVF